MLSWQWSVCTAWLIGFTCLPASVWAMQELTEDHIHKGIPDDVMAPLQSGTSRLADVEAWTRGIREPLKLIHQDVNGDGEKDILAPIRTGQGATGNQRSLVFIANQRRFRFVGEIGRLVRCLRYHMSPNAYLLQLSDTGPRAELALFRLGATRITRVGQPQVLSLGDAGSVADRRRYLRLVHWQLSESVLLHEFSTERLIDPAGIAKAWVNPNGYQFNQVSYRDGRLQMRLQGKKPIDSLRMSLVNAVYEVELTGRLQHVRGNVYLLLVDGDIKQDQVHMFVGFYQDDQKRDVRLVFSPNLLECENL